MKVEQILATDTKGKSLSELISMLGSTADADAIWKLRKRHEEDTGIPMEEDDIGKGEEDVAEFMFPEVTDVLRAHDAEQTKGDGE